MNSNERNIGNILYLNRSPEMINNQTKASFVLQHRQLSTVEHHQKMIMNVDLNCQCISLRNFIFLAIIIMPFFQTMVRCHNLTNAPSINIDGIINDNNSNSDNFSKNLNLIPVIQSKLSV